MDFSFSEEQQQLQDAVTRFLQGDYSFEHRRAVIASAEGWSRDTWKGLADLGVLAMNVPEAHGGLGYGPIETLLAMQPVGAALLCEPLLESAVIATALVRDAATVAQQEELLASMAAGERIVVLAHLEPAARGEAGWVEASARLDGGHVVLNGDKAVVLHAAAADELLVTARSAGEAGDAQGVSVYRVPRGTPGLALDGYPTLDGRRAAEVRLRDVRLPAGACLGTAGAALPAVARALDVGLAAVCAEALGVMQASVDATVEYLKTRHQFGQPIGRFQALQHRTADMLMHLEQSRSMAYLAAMNCQLADDAQRRKTLSCAKIVIGQACRYIAQQSVQLHGGMGMSDELNVSHWFKRLLSIELSFGDTDFHLQRFAEITQRDIPQAA